MDKETRNRIQFATQTGRALLERDYGEQLEGTFDIRMDGTIASEPGSHLSAEERILRQKVIAAVEHQKASGVSNVDAVVAYLREAAFTTLNRFIALKMLEPRGLVQECISRGDQSSGFKEFTGLASGLVQLPDHGYRLYIESLFDEIGREVRVLFDRRDPASLLWPRRQALLDLLAVLNDSELAEVWKEDETIGWVYQYFNSDEERRQMRAESQAPRNSRELAIRNQFFTPRYVLEFLTDNTLGRIWYEMRQGKTRLVEKCQYLVRRPNEVFLAKGQEAPADYGTSDDNLSQEALLKKTVYIPYRPKKDPRDLKILDSACGSGHFLLYSFDLLLTLYEEAWEDADGPRSGVTGKSLREDFDSPAELRTGMPELILRHNLYGIDIDPRCTQIAALALWMRAQRAYNDFDIAHSHRVAIAKTNITVAEPMPGEEELRVEFTASLDKPLGQLVERVFEKMELAGEAGSLLRIEEEIQAAILNVYGKHGELFLKSDEERWREAQTQLLDVLRAYAERAQNGRAYMRRLFAEDSARGFGFIDLLTQRYDVVLMNPPFGAPPDSLHDAVLGDFGVPSTDVYPPFALRALELCDRCYGYVGTISPRTFLYQIDFIKFRACLLELPALIPVAAELGLGVIDDATVRSVAWTACARRGNGTVRTTYVDATHEADKSMVIKKIVDRPESFARWLPSDFAELPGTPFLFKASSSLVRLLRSAIRLDPFLGKSHRGERAGIVRIANGLQSGDDFRWVRLCSEVPTNGLQKRWSWYLKPIEFQPYLAEIAAVINWANDGRSIKETFRSTGVSPSRYVSGEEFYFQTGSWYPDISESGIGAAPIHKSAIASRTGLHIVHRASISEGVLTAFLNSELANGFLGLWTPDRHHKPTYVGQIPYWLEKAAEAELAAIYDEIAALLTPYRVREYSVDFAVPWLAGLVQQRHPFEEIVRLIQEDVERLQTLVSKADKVVARTFPGSPDDIEFIKQFSQRRQVSEWFPKVGGSVEEYGREGIVELCGWLLGWRGEHRDGGCPVGILADDQGGAYDLVDEVQGRAQVVFDEEGQLERFILTAFGARTLREFYRSYFFSAHVRLHSKSGRKAPIYWQLAIPSASYSVWLYYHLFTKDTFYKVLNDYVTPKVQHEERKLTSLVQTTGGSPSASQRKKIAEQEAFVEELRAFREEVARVAPLWNPDLNDGVITNFAPLWRLVSHHRAWQKECKECWEKLVAGEYNWANLAMHLWPERVVPKCAEDRSLAIAHGLEEVLWVEGGDGKWEKRKVDQGTINRLIAERTSPAVKDALQSLLNAPALGTRRGSNRGKTGRRSSPRRSRPISTDSRTDGSVA